MFNPYGSIPILDDDGDSTGWNIYMFRADDKGIQNIINEKSNPPAMLGRIV